MRKIDNDRIYCRRITSSAGVIEIRGDEHCLMEIRFVRPGTAEKDKETNCDSSTPALDRAVEFFNAYFNHKVPNCGMPVRLVNYDSEQGHAAAYKNDAGILYCDVRGFSNKEIAVYEVLLQTNFGETVTYKELADRAGLNGANRFAGNCMAKNRFPILIPCHRVIKSDGIIGNYSGGKRIKELLLIHETRFHCDE